MRVNERHTHWRVMPIQREKHFSCNDVNNLQNANSTDTNVLNSKFNITCLEGTSERGTTQRPTAFETP